MKSNILIILSCMLVSAHAANTQGPVIVGNGDDGTDLESFSPITEGSIVETRKKAVKLLKSYKVGKIKNLGNLIPEVENTKLYMTNKGLSPKKLAELGAFTDDSTGLIYARTMPETYASTRFFPAATNLNEKQLIALHIHEALHRALPERYRENESIAIEITQSITTPDTSRDKIEKTVARLVKDEVVATNGAAHYQMKKEIVVSEKSRLKSPSLFAIEGRIFEDTDEKNFKTLDSKIKSMYIVKSHLYPFGGKANAIGIGVDVSVIKTEDDTFMGPLSLSARSLVYTARDFDFELFMQANLNSLSDEELKTSLLGRDTTKLGLTMGTRKERFYVENDLTYTLESEINEEIGEIETKYTFGGIYGVNLRVGAQFGKLMIGTFGEILMSENFKVQSGDFATETGRNRIVSWGPNIEWRDKDYSIALKGRFLVDSTKNTSYDYLSDLMGYGVGQGSISTQLNIFF